MDEQPPAEPPAEFGIRQLLRVVSLKDFAQMVAGESGQIASSIALAFQTLPRFPFGPLLFAGGLLMAGIRGCLLVLVVCFLGGAILAITVVRAIAHLAPKRAKNSD